MEESSSLKNYVSLLNEILSKMKILPDYKVVVKGTGSNTRFTIQLEVDGKTAVGTGRSKKEAKLICAQEMYELLKKESLLPPPKNTATNDNAVGYLYQFCQLSGWTAPKFDIISEHGPSHKKIFAVSCKFHEFTTEGHGSSLKQARHSAASHMIPLLKTFNLSNIKFKEEENPGNNLIMNKVNKLLNSRSSKEENPENNNSTFPMKKVNKLLNSPSSKDEKNSTDASDTSYNKRCINSRETASEPKKRKTYKSSKEDVDFSIDLISKFNCLSLEKKEELKTQIRNLVDSFMDEHKKLFTCSRVIQVLKERNRITDKSEFINPYEPLFEYFKTEPFVNKSQIINTNKEIDVENIDDPEELFKTIAKEYDIAYSFKKAKSAKDKNIVFLIMKTEDKKWTLVGSGINAEIIAIRQALKFLIVMSK